MRPIRSLPDRRIAVLAFVLIATHACDAREEDAARRDAGDAVTQSEGAASVPFETGDAFPLPFRTTVPGGMTAEIEEGVDVEGLAGAVRFATAAEHETAFLRLVVLDGEMDANDARGLVRSIATDFGLIGSQGLEYDEATSPPGHAWATTGYRLRGVVHGERVDGWLSLGQHDGRFFYVMALAPESVAARLTPAWDRILAEWTWVADGEVVPLSSSRR